ncbi:MAG TPA: toll/interleukin-1 receptor domain-containing protein [Thermoleophilaceae bacterium]|nr:toll/interleukin-1 receptor domain-containing protein [Thermoleophilaceae bacterium]
MTYEYGCFISHIGSQRPLITEFVTSLETALASELEAHIDGSAEEVYLDRTRLKPGFMFNEALADAICKSACWIVVYVPQYPFRDYCMREFRAMQMLEERRRRELGHRIERDQGMIFPVILRGGIDQLPVEIAKQRQYLDFKKYSTADVEILRNERYQEQLVQLASQIGDLYRLGDHLGDQDCGRFAMPRHDADGADGADGSFRPVTAEFPGRSAHS